MLLHVLFVAALLRAVVLDKRPEKSATALTLVLLPMLEQPQKAAPTQAQGGNAAGAISVPAPVFQNANPSAQALAIGEALFGCRPENLRDLSREQQDKCLKLSANRYVAMKNGLPIYVRPKGPEWEGLSNSDLRARERNTADPCAIAKMGKMATAECYHDITHEKGLW